MKAKGERCTVLSATHSDTGDPAARLSASGGTLERSDDVVSRISTATEAVPRCG
jgi:hypothetical protein